MYSKDQASQLRQAFWTAFGQYITPHPSAEGIKINWVNYKTGIKYLHFKMHADTKNDSLPFQFPIPIREYRN
ncbi:DUF4268 domain-containing protein [Pedobacter sp. AW31-3R]|uniref:DUF4268 domain-containing protein n=1 Tax=Pedobacter sp. AW31-3R TaxID=3445781 RepID=UPI003FA05014